MAVDCRAGASLHATCQRTTRTFGAVAGVAAPVVDGQRVVSAAGSVTCRASALAAPAVDYRPGGAAAAASSTAASGRVDFSSAVGCWATAGLVADARRTVRAGVRVSATAVSEVEAETYVFAYTSPARCTAWLEATTGKFAWGSVSAAAACQADGAAVRPASGEVFAHAGCIAAARTDSNAGGEARAIASAALDPFIQRGGVKLFDGNVEALGAATLTAEPYIYSVALTVGRAIAVAVPQVQRPANVSAFASAHVSLDAQIVVPETGAIAVGGSATCSAVAAVIYRGKGSAAMVCAVDASARRRVAASGAVVATARGDQLATATGIRAAVRANFLAVAVCQRTTAASVYSLATAWANAANQVNDIGHAPPWRTASLPLRAADVVVAASDRNVTQLGIGRSMAA